MSAPKEKRGSASDFHKEVKCMMYSFGGSKHPYSESVSLIESITHSQISAMIRKATDVSRWRGKRSMSIDDILFLLRKNKDKLRALLRYLQAKDIAKRVQSADSDGYNLPPPKKRKYSLEFLNTSDQAAVESKHNDPAFIQTLQRMDEITRDMNRTEYMHYSQCRQANFYKNTAKFVEWLDLGSLTDFKLSQEVIEVFGYLAYETVREVVELSLQVKEDAEHSLLSAQLPHQRSSGAQFGTTPTFITVPTDSTPSPPASPSPPPQPPPPPPPTQQQTTQEPSSTSPPRSPGSTSRRKKKQVPGALTLPSSAPQDEGQHRAAGAGAGAGAIHPRHVREAIRRYQFQMGPMTPMTAHFSKPTFYKRTLCA